MSPKSMTMKEADRALRAAAKEGDLAALEAAADSVGGQKLFADGKEGADWQKWLHVQRAKLEEAPAAPVVEEEEAPAAPPATEEAEAAEEEAEEPDAELETAETALAYLDDLSTRIKESPELARSGMEMAIPSKGGRVLFSLGHPLRAIGLKLVAGLFDEEQVKELLMPEEESKKPTRAKADAAAKPDDLGTSFLAAVEKSSAARRVRRRTTFVAEQHAVLQEETGLSLPPWALERATAFVSTWQGAGVKSVFRYLTSECIYVACLEAAARHRKKEGVTAQELGCSSDNRTGLIQTLMQEAEDDPVRAVELAGKFVTREVAGKLFHVRRADPEGGGQPFRGGPNARGSGGR